MTKLFTQPNIKMSKNIQCDQIAMTNFYFFHRLKLRVKKKKFVVTMGSQ